MDPLETLENLEKACDPSSPLYKFTHTFYNLAEKQYPVELKGYPELIKRYEKQKEVVEKLNGALLAMTQRIDNLNAKSMIINQRMQKITKAVRLLRGYGIEGKVVFKKVDEKLECTEECVKYLRLMRRVLANLSSSVKNEIKDK